MINIKSITHFELGISLLCFLSHTVLTFSKCMKEKISLALEKYSLFSQKLG